MEKFTVKDKERYIFSKENSDSKIWEVFDRKYIGRNLFSFDKKIIYNFFEDYPQNFTPEQKELFDKEFPFWKNFYEGKSTEVDGEEII